MAQGSAGNVIAALCSFFIPGLGQLVQARVLWAIIWFVAGGVLWFLTLGTFGWIINILSCIHAAMFRGGK